MDKGIIMKTAHWSSIYLTYVIIEINFSDGSRQGWNYDCSHFATIEDMKLNMAADFRDPRKDATVMHLFVTRNDDNWSGELPVTDLTEEDFVNYIFDEIEDMLTWQQAEIS